MIKWLTAFLDLAPESYDEGVRFWCAATGDGLSAPRGEHDEFVTFMPEHGDATLKAQRLQHGPSRLHLDLHVDDPRASAEAAIAHGAMEIADHGYVVMRSPAGLPFCFVSHQGSGDVPPVRTWPSGQTGAVYQVCLDIPGSDFDAETTFWSRILGAELDPFARRQEFAWLRPTPGLDVLLQRLEEQHGDARAHLDCGSDDRRKEVERHLALGAEIQAEEEFWTVLTDPAGLPYCITDRAHGLVGLHVMYLDLTPHPENENVF